MLKKGTPASPATARESNVLPVPGGPTISTPRGMRAPSAANFSGNLRNSTISCSSSFASSTPATSTNVTVTLVPVNMRARLLPKLIACEFEPCAWRIMNRIRAPKMMSGRKLRIKPNQLPNWLGSFTETATALGPVSGMPASFKSWKIVSELSLREWNFWFCSYTVSESPDTSIF